jgi:hypothetical protein
MRELPTIGATFYPPADPLASLAGALIVENQDDRMLHYSMELKPVQGEKRNNGKPLTKTRYNF